MSINADDKEKVKLILEKGKKQGYVTHDDILDVFPDIEDNLELLEYIISTMQQMEIEMIEPISDSNTNNLLDDDISLEQDSEYGKYSKMSLEEKINILKTVRSHVNTDPTRAYLSEIGKIPLLTSEEEVVLARRIEEANKEMLKIIVEVAKKENVDKVYIKAASLIEKGIHKGSAINQAKKRLEEKDKQFLNKIVKDGIEAKYVLIKANLRLVVAIAKKYLKRGLDMLDLIEEGNLGLMKAVDKFQYRKGFKFSTYATWWIRQAITRAIADQARTIRVPVHMIETINKLSKVSAQLTDQLGRKPTAKEIAEAMGLSEEKVLEIIKISQKPQSLETAIGEDGDGKSTLLDLVADQDTASPQELATSSYLKKQINEILNTLTPREKKVLELRFGLKDGVARTLEEVGQEFNVTRERIRQIESKAIRRIRNQKIAQALRDYLK
ncbi:MAG: RNA polymerase sigma factor RpoD [Candidatus Dojkabacteria bacterium]|nr:RNA polymerase sigma factor RpoD [Candidatus Dojkabacteria bacterium]